MAINTKYNLDEIVYLPFRIDGVRIEIGGGTDYKLIANFATDNLEYDSLRNGYTISESDLIISGETRSTKVFCCVGECAFIKDFDPEKELGICSKGEIVLDEEVIAGCPDVDFDKYY